MTDAREQNESGIAPNDPGSGAHAHGAVSVADTESVKTHQPVPGSVAVPMRDQPRLAGQGQNADHRPSVKSAAPNLASVLASAALALLFGGAGAWAYEQFLARPRAEVQSESSQPKAGDAEDEKKIARLDERINSLSDQYKQIQARVEAMPKPEPPPDLGPLEQKAARIDGLSKDVEAIRKAVDALPQQLEKNDQRITALATTLDGARKDVDALRERLEASSNRAASPSSARGPSPTRGPEEASPSPGNEAQTDSDLGPGVSLFRAGRYNDAYIAFRDLVVSRPDDARLWYYAALSYGLATGRWDGETLQMVRNGVAREKAATPKKPEIDSAFAGLTKANGKEWLDFYRRQAG